MTWPSCWSSPSSRSGLRDDRTLHGVLVFAGLFSSVWWAWAGFTFYANRFDTDDVVYRLAKLAAMLASGLAIASATEATGTLAAQFAFCHAAIRMVLVALYLRAYRHVAQARGLIVVYLTAAAIAAGLWLAGAMVSGPARPKLPGWSRCDRGDRAGGGDEALSRPAPAS